MSEQEFSHYKKDVRHLDMIDVYRVLDLFEVTDHAVGHACKKLLCAGMRGGKNCKQDIEEAFKSLKRKLEMMQEDESSSDCYVYTVYADDKKGNGASLEQDLRKRFFEILVVNKPHTLEDAVEFINKNNRWKPLYDNNTSS